MSEFQSANDDDFEPCVDSIYESLFGILVSVGAISALVIALAVTL